MFPARFDALSWIDSSYWVSILLVAPLLLISFYLYKTWAKLRHIPGPFFAQFTDFPRFLWVRSRKAHEIHIDLHAKYGKLVRFGPNMVSVGDPSEISNIYRMHTPLLKSDFYHVILPMSKGKVMPGLFATQDEALHRTLKKPIASIYSMTNLVSFEPFVDSTIGVFFEQLDKRFVKTGAVCDWDVWLQYFAFDVVGELTFSRRLGFLERAEDVDGIMRGVWKWFEYAAPNSFISRLRPARWSPMVEFAMKRQVERLSAVGKEEGLNQRDFLSRFIAAMDKDPSIPKWALPAWTGSNILAGSDTTAIFLRTLFHNLLAHPSTLARLRNELDAAASSGHLSIPTTWKESLGLPYLDACIKEAGRIHPPFGLPLERIVPAGGMTVCGEYLAPGTIVGMNAWVVHRDQETFGKDADAWRPERWLVEGETRKRMESGLLTFGGGHRTCLGKNISHLEIYKVVPTILQVYDIELMKNSQVLHIENRFFVPQSGFQVRLKKRASEKHSKN
ncbi:hypothetical protein EPUS_06924 [Endocarpon pusillum Z07020]|uniref:Pisatin demethylase n=1 Tax=Endocarpon pusillum (strain Z07020 / HMAS-L-300199) TaxID=1263415 RepID=U1G7Z8_ENDPU|nr:uncharacterized protein EPUS_06924 [Endocarpon pusillum Z07020]ERF68113.1 hypothetical protein EPUS_06924 [Endocarpon pusillum Z07020]